MKKEELNESLVPQIELINEETAVQLGGANASSFEAVIKTCGNLRQCGWNNDNCPKLEKCNWN